MSANAPTTPLNPYASLPKVELHRHLEGSLRLETMAEVARAHGVTIPENIVDLSSLVQVQEEEPYTFANFLEKFKTLRLFYRSPEVIGRVTREAIEDAARDNVRYMELRFTPVALSRAERFPLSKVVEWVCESAAQAARDFQIEVRLIASVNRHESPELAEQVAWLAADRIAQGIVGLDLAGNEVEFPAEPFVPIFREARQAGLQVTIHAGEWAGAHNVRQAIEAFEAARIGHGVRVLEDAEVVALARERGTVFEVCITSNYQSGVVPALSAHPLPRMIQAGLVTTLNTDDPSVSRITLSNEYRLAAEDLGLPMAILKEQTLAAARASFLPEADRADLIARLSRDIQPT